MKWDKINIKNDTGELVETQAPVIISASRSTDIPAFYSDWFIERIKKGYIKWKNPFNGVPLYVSFQNARLIIFWSKNPEPLIKHIDFISEKIPNFYFQFTLNDYDNELFEPNVPEVTKRIETFIKLSEKVGKSKVIWRFDPLILTANLDVQQLLKKVQKIGDSLKNYTNKLVFSFADIKTYNKVQNNLHREKINYQEFNDRTMYEFATGLNELNKNWNFELGTCAEKIDLLKYSIQHNKCIDDDLIIKLFYKDTKLMNFLGVNIKQPDMFNPNFEIIKNKKNNDSGQRTFCGCIVSKDIGEYNTCPHLCVYCYANTTAKIALNNFEQHKLNPFSDTITGK